MARRYPKEVHSFIEENVAGRTTRQLTAMVNERFGEGLFTESSMKSYKANHKLRSGTPCGLPKDHASETFPQHVGDYIRANYIGVGPKEMAERLNKRFGASYTSAQLKGFYANHKLSSGLTGHFEKGCVPPNKGKKGVRHAGCEKGWFAKGHTPFNKLPIGTVLMKSDGYLWRKLGEGARDWRQEHILVWEAANGQIPEGHKIIFKDGDRTNCDLGNLAMCSNDVHLQMVRRGLRFEDPELTETGMMVAKVQRAAFGKKVRKKQEE